MSTAAAAGKSSSTPPLPPLERERQLDRQLGDIESRTGVLSAELRDITEELLEERSSAQHALQKGAKEISTILAAVSTATSASPLPPFGGGIQFSGGGGGQQMYREVADALEVLAEVSIQIQGVCADVDRAIDKHREELLRNYSEYRELRERWMDTMRQLSSVSDSIDEGEVIGKLGAATSTSTQKLSKHTERTTVK